MTRDDLERLFTESIPEATQGWKKKRVMLYLHGGLNDEKSVARRVIAFRDVFLENEIYPLHIMWETDFWNSLRNQVFDMLASERVDLVIPIDYPGFNMKLAAAARRAGVPVLYYVTPQVWAWGAKRLPKLARIVTRAAVILPFEEQLPWRPGISA